MRDISVALVQLRIAALKLASPPTGQAHFKIVGYVFALVAMVLILNGVSVDIQAVNEHGIQALDEHR